MTEGTRTVALVDWYWSGHHPTYFSLFASALLENGVRVLPCCPEPGGFETTFASSPAGQKGGDLALLESTLTVYLPPRNNLYPLRLQHIEQSLRHFSQIGKMLGRWEKTHRRKIDLVFFACIYDPHFKWMRYARLFFPYQWSGLYLHARSFRIPGSRIPLFGCLPCPERIFTLRSLYSMAVLDEGAVPQLTAMTGGKPVVVFPDIADERLPAQLSPATGLARKLRMFAGGRKIVVLVGHLLKTKGILELCRTAMHASMQGHCFFFGGEVLWDDMSPLEKREILEIWENAPNVLTHLQRIDDGPAFNAILAEADIIFAAYTNFPNSSNILSKAAAFHRPIIVSDGYLMAERTRRYRLGAVVREGDVSDIVEAIKCISSPPAGSLQREPPRWKEYTADHSYARLRTAFREIMSDATPPHDKSLASNSV